jgi:bacillithiol system protein YtxJ
MNRLPMGFEIRACHERERGTGQREVLKPMQEIIDESGLDAALEASNSDPIFLFKHSTACPISAAAYQEVKRAAKDEVTPPLYLVLVIESRIVSNAIAKRLGVIHKSPQLILVDRGEAKWDVSHYEIKAERIAEAAPPGA